MNQKELCKGLTILNKYIKDDDDFNYCDDDQMCFAPDKKDLNQDDLDELERLGFWWCETYECWSCYL